VPRNPIPADEDRILSQPSNRVELFRLFAVEPHGWSTVLLEDQNRTIYLASTVTGSLSRLSGQEAEGLIAQRAYRMWHGERSWAPLESLPLISSSFARNLAQQSTGDESTLM
jgi:hypothetical protein